MAFAIQITEVGPAEFPLIQTLRDKIFSEFGHVSRSSIAAQLADQPDLLLLMAHLEGNPVGFAAGYKRTPELFYLNYIGMLKDYRRQGLGRLLIGRQIDFARARSYRRIEFNSFNHFPWMLRLGLAAGFYPCGMVQDEGSNWKLAIRFQKNLMEELAPPDDHSVPDFNVDEFRCSSENIASIKQALDAGFQFRGMIQKPDRKYPLMILDRKPA